jgi:hypothetical protein
MRKVLKLINPTGNLFGIHRIDKRMIGLRQHKVIDFTGIFIHKTPPPIRKYSTKGKETGWAEKKS